ncbi:unnamed protein product [Protopolystoma xenopodis]|uniref:TOG domain-containing protein n=1 Tax=Protopolystoma xenopodis TaxID=117903 RepID=A0A3S5BJJ1_9PLAT|nr:unnamed protein product [Protopolystoma xenopodis]
MPRDPNIQIYVAARALGDIVRKLGDRILADIIPILEAGLDSEITDQRRGVCTGLIELMRNCTKEQLSSANYSSDFIVFIRRAISDHQPEVRRAGARAFDLLHNSLGVRAIDGLLPDLLAQLDASQQDSAQHAATLDGLRQLLTVKSKAVMPHLVPKVISCGSPIIYFFRPYNHM